VECYPGKRTKPKRPDGGTVVVVYSSNRSWHQLEVLFYLYYIDMLEENFVPISSFSTPCVILDLLKRYKLRNSALKPAEQRKKLISYPPYPQCFHARDMPSASALITMLYQPHIPISDQRKTKQIDKKKGREFNLLYTIFSLLSSRLRLASGKNHLSADLAKVFPDSSRSHIFYTRFICNFFKGCSWIGIQQAY
jgi:hypothetical protein